MAILRTALPRRPTRTSSPLATATAAHRGYCPNFRKGRPLYREFMDAARELKGKVTFGGLFTMFGITEYHRARTAWPPSATASWAWSTRSAPIWACPTCP